MTKQSLLAGSLEHRLQLPLGSQWDWLASRGWLLHIKILTLPFDMLPRWPSSLPSTVLMSLPCEEFQDLLSLYSKYDLALDMSFSTQCHLRGHRLVKDLDFLFMSSGTNDIL